MMMMMTHLTIHCYIVSDTDTNMKLTTANGEIDDSYNDAVLSTEEAVEVSSHGLI
jgi:hypothetical protein